MATVAGLSLSLAVGLGLGSGRIQRKGLYQDPDLASDATAACTPRGNGPGSL